MAKSFIFEKFGSITDYVNTITSRDANSVFKGHTLSSMKQGDSSWNGTSSYEESVQLVSTGYKKGLEDINNAKHEKLNVSVHTPKSMPTSAPIGFAPIVANALLGLPNSMIYKKSVTHKTRVVSIWYDTTAACNVSKEEMTKAGRNILEVVMMLEAQGYRVELNMVTIMSSSKSVVGSVVKLKTDKQPMNPLKISYPLTHASYLRRQGFRWLETCPKIDDSGFLGGYGHPFYYDDENSENRRQMLRDKGVITDTCFYTDYYEAKGKTPADLIKSMGLK